MGNILRHLDNSATPQNLEKSQVGTILHYLVALYDYLRGAPHIRADATNTIAADDADDQDSVNTLLNELKADYNLHCAVTAPTHLAADSTNTIAANDASSLATSLTLAIELQDDIPAHLALTSSHYQADTNTPAQTITDSPTTLAEVILVANELKAMYTNHIAAALCKPGSTTFPALGDIGAGGV